MKNNKQRLPYLEMKSSARQLQPGDLAALSVPSQRSGGSLWAPGVPPWRPGGTLWAPDVSQKVKSRAFCQQPPLWCNVLPRKNWDELGKEAITGYPPASLPRQPPKEILSSLFKRLKVIEVCKDRLSPQQGLLKWHHGLLWGYITGSRPNVLNLQRCFLIPAFVVEACVIFILFFLMERLCRTY